MFENFLDFINAMEDAYAAEASSLIEGYLAFAILTYALVVSFGTIGALLPDVFVALLGPILFNATRLRCSATRSPKFLNLASLR